MSITTMDGLTRMAGKFHPQLGDDPGISQCRRKTMPERVESPSRNLAVTAALDGLQIYAGFTHDALETLAEPVSASGSFVCHARHNEDVRLVRGRQFLQMGLKFRVKRNSDFLPGLALNISNRARA